MSCGGRDELDLQNVVQFMGVKTDLEGDDENGKRPVHGDSTVSYLPYYLLN